MRYSKEQMDEIDILIRYNLQTTQQGIIQTKNCWQHG